MNKKSLIGIIIAIIVALGIGVTALLLLNNKNDNEEQKPAEENNLTSGEKETIDMGKTLVAYYSAQNHTEAVAKEIVENVEADLFEIEPVEVYTEEDLDWTDDNSRVNREHLDESLRAVELVATTVPNWDEYDTVFVGYPIWWGIAAWPTEVFVKANNFDGKTVIPFCTSTSSGLGDSATLLAEAAGSGNWLTGYRFSSSASSDEVRNWLESLQ